MGFTIKENKGLEQITNAGAKSPMSVKPEQASWSTWHGTVVAASEVMQA
jgi:hypothetical protein